MNQRQDPLSLETEGDASSAAFWLATGVLGWPVLIQNFPSSKRQADTAMVELLPLFHSQLQTKEDGVWAKTSGQDQIHSSIPSTRRICITHTPDLAPLLGVLSCLLPGKTVLYGGEHLRHKESNRIEDFAKAFSRMGLVIETRPDGLEMIGPRIPRAGTVETFGDHRLAMVGCLCASRTPFVLVQNPTVVTKSYARFWEHARCVGWTLTEETAK